MPQMMQRPESPALASQGPRAPIVRGGAPEQSPPPSRPAVTVAQADWKPIKIPSPTQLGIAPAGPATTVLPVTTLTLPDRYDLATVTAWLDGLGARSCQRERLAEGVRFVCIIPQSGQPDQTVTARGVSDEDALKALVQEVVRCRQQPALSLR